jgi:hypothetical protein
MECMNKVAELIAKVLRGRSTATVEVEPVCCVPQCEDRPAMMLAATESQAVMACAAHARQWVASRECRYAAGNAGPGIVTILRRWAASVAASVGSIGPDVGPRTDPPHSTPSSRSPMGMYFLRQDPANR